jgi:hypothetical protein
MQIFTNIVNTMSILKLNMLYELWLRDTNIFWENKEENNHSLNESVMIILRFVFNSYVAANG